MKKHIIHYSFFFYIHKKLNIQKAHEIKNNVFSLFRQETRKG